MEESVVHTNCTQSDIKAIRDSLEVLSGLWKLQILAALSSGPMRFKEISREVSGISDKMLSKELKDLEINLLVKRSVFDTFPPTVEYCATEHARTLERVIVELRNWGVLHRKKIIAR